MIYHTPKTELRLRRYKQSKIARKIRVSGERGQPRSRSSRTVAVARLPRFTGPTWSSPASDLARRRGSPAGRERAAGPVRRRAARTAAGSAGVGDAAERRGGALPDRGGERRRGGGPRRRRSPASGKEAAQASGSGAGSGGAETGRGGRPRAPGPRRRRCGPRPRGGTGVVGGAGGRVRSGGGHVRRWLGAVFF